MILELLQNVALLVTLSVGLQVLARRFHRPGVPYQLTAGVLFGAVGVTAMMTPMHFAPGVIYDGQTVILSLAGFIGGPLTATTAALIATGYRLLLGGAGALVGIFVIVQSTVFGVVFYYLRRRNPHWEQPLRIWVLGLVVHIAMLLTQLLLPENLGRVVLPVIGPSVLFLYPLAFLVTALVFLGNEQRRALDVVLTTQNHMLEMIATGAPLTATLNALVKEIEAQLPSLKASILVLDETGRYLHYAAAPSLPAAYVADTDGIEIGDGVGSCGTAIWRRRQIIVENIATDPLWADYRTLALRHNLRASWSTPIFDDADHVLGTFAMYYDKPTLPTVSHLQLIEQATHLASIAITRDRQEQVLRAERDFAHRVMDTMSEGLSVTDAQEHITYANQAFADMVGWKPAEMLGVNPFDFAILEDSESFQNQLAELRAQGIRSSYELRLRHKDGHELPALISGAPYVRDGRFLGTIAVITDLSERVRVENALRESEERYRGLIDTSPFAIGVFQHGKIVFANRAAAQLLGVAAPSTLVNKPVGEVVAAEELAGALGHIRQILTSGTGLYAAENRVLRADGRCVPVEVIAAPFRLDGHPAVQVIAQDITERKRRQRELSAQAQIAQALSQTAELQPLLERILEAAIHAVETASKGSILLPDANDILQIQAVYGYHDPCIPTVRFARNFGYGARAVQERRPLLIADVRSDPEIAYVGGVEEIGTVQSAIVAPLTVGGAIIGVIALDNTERRAAFDKDDLSVLTNIAATAALVIERAQLFEEINMQARQMTQIMQTAPQGLLLINAEGRVLMANPMGERDLTILAGAQPGDIVSHLGEWSLSEFLQIPSIGPWHEVDVKERVYEIIARPVPGEHEPEQWVVLIDDVTRARQIREQAEQQERLATVGQLAAGIAHDFNNILNVILLHAQMASIQPGSSNDQRQRMKVIVDEAHNASNLIRQILDFSRQSLLQRQPVDLASLLAEQVQLLERAFPETITMELTPDTELAGNAYQVDADPTRLRQVLMNLAINARDAMPEGGKISFKLERVTKTQQTASLSGVAAGEWIRLTVADTGTGIPPETLPRIFDPFFTTKGPDKGTGLGLAQVHGIIAQHDGQLTVESEMGCGTRFIIHLPALDDGHVVIATPAAAEAPTGYQHLVLLVEDNPALRMAMTDMIESLDYAVVAASNGREAMQQMTARGADFALVLSDVVMPEMGGIALVHALREHNWATPVILMSGHPLDGEMDSLKDVAISGVLPKPCSMDMLAQTLAAAAKPTPHADAV